MSKGNNINDFLALMKGVGKSHVKVQTAWCIVKKVDWENKLMDVEGISDGLLFQDVLLGLGNVYRKPKLGSKCLVGLIENNDAAAFLIEAEALDFIELHLGSVLIEIDSMTSKIKVKNGQVSLIDLFQDLKNLIFQLKVTTPAGPSTSLLPDSVTALQAFEMKFKQLLN